MTAPQPRVTRSTGATVVRLLRQCAARSPRTLLGLGAVQLVGTLAALSLPAVDAGIIDRGVARGDTSAIVVLGAVMLAAGGVHLLCSVVAVHLGSRVSMGFGRDLRQALFDRVTGMSMHDVSKFGPATLLTRTTTDVQTVETTLHLYWTTLVAALITGTGGVVMAARQDVGLSWVLLLAVPVLAAITSGIMARLIAYERRMQKLFDRMNQILREQLSGIRVIRAFARESFERDRFAAVSAGFSRTALAADRWQALLAPVATLIISLSSVALVWFGALRIDAGDMGVGQLVAFMLYATQILSAASMLSKVLANVPGAAASFERITEVLWTDVAVSPPENRVCPPAGGDLVRFDHVTFAYPGAQRAVLCDVSFTAAPGSVTAIVGATGSGKSTMISLLTRLYDATAGSVSVDGVDVRDLAADQLCARTAVVPQHGYLFSGTVADNLRFGKPDATNAEMWAALRISAADGFVAAHPDGLRMPVAQGGINLSGGQRQRLAIARAVIRRPAVYLFDDAFSALDACTQRDVWTALRESCADAAVILVSQRINPGIEADQVIVMGQGSVGGPVAATSGHESLLADCPRYGEVARTTA
ncbi:putative ABC transporter ATP-binding protein [Mycobacterium basiliense]|uniref:Putative ABC transporter ATP-binding protein n=1 Tax=Mycobacterium basiliense TaxID=2094119 RepID=A0A447GG36_9MYCO|nr:ABC transporter ATP-binding protein [Mycobacterium basiliense]VDM89398.1 putative ABC transporter ATP-binding protein [Mycobacterium basiliense]